MENKVNLHIELGLQRDEDQGDVAVVAFDLPRSVAERVCREQESCQLLLECGDLTRLLNAYAVMNGYQCAWFISAEMEESVVSSQKQLITDFDVANAQKQGAGQAECIEARDATMFQESKQDDSANALIEENAELRESVLFLQTELEEARKSVQAHELAGKFFEMKNTQLEKKLEVADAERADAVKEAIYRMRDELKRGRIHFDGISLKAIPFDSVDVVAEKVLREVADGTKK